jgi:RNA polymerase sigma factor (sigma-70 family)
MMEFGAEPGTTHVDHVDQYHQSLQSLDIRRLLPAENPCPADRAEAWRACWDAVGTAVLKYIRCKNRTSTDDKDILADSMATAYVEIERGKYQYRADVPFTAYVKGIARNKIFEAYRRDRRCVPLSDGYDGIDEYDFEAAVESLEDQERLQRCLSELSPRRRQVLLLLCEGHDTSQIASNLGIREDLVRQEKSRGIQQLRRILQS